MLLYRHRGGVVARSFAFESQGLGFESGTVLKVLKAPKRSPEASKGHLKTTVDS